MTFVFLDESGILTKSEDKYFIVATYTVGDARKVSKAFKKWQKTKFPKKLRGQSEIKFNDSHIDDKLRLKTIKYFAKQNIKIYYTFLKKNNIPKEYYKKGKVSETGLLYTEIVRSTLDLYTPISDNQFIIIRDRRTLKGVTVSKFNDVLKLSLLPKLPAKVQFRIDAVDSTNSSVIQIVDWICGALARYHEDKRMGNDFYDALKSCVVQKKELFEDQWAKK